MLLMTLIILSVIYVVYILVGAAIFMAIEKTDAPPEPMYVTESTVFNTFIDDNACVTTTAAQQFARDIIHAYDTNQLRVTNTSSAAPNNNWDFDISIFFVITAITTIGYGNVTPTTVGGKIFFFVYALHGIPLTAVLLIGLGERIVKPYQKFEGRRFTDNYPRAERYIKRAMSIAITYTFFSIIPAVIFTQVEGWTFLDSWYFTMVTLTTVGFGDIIPTYLTGAYGSLYKVLTGLWVFCGLAWLSCLFSIISAQMTDTSKAIDEKIEEKCERCRATGTSKATDNKIGAHCEHCHARDKAETNGEVKQYKGVDNKNGCGLIEVKT